MKIESNNAEALISSSIANLSHIVLTVMDQYVMEVENLTKQVTQLVMERDQLRKEVESLKTPEVAPLSEK